MINLTKDNINKAIVNKAFDMVKKNELGYLYTDETICNPIHIGHNACLFR